MARSERQPPLEVIDEGEVTTALDESIRRLLYECFPDAADVYAHTRIWHGSTPVFSVISRDGDLVVGHVGVIFREIRCGREGEGIGSGGVGRPAPSMAPLAVAGVQGVCVAPGWRGTGLSRRLMTAAMNEAAGRGVHFGLLFCVPRLEPFYASQGWSRLDCPVTMLDEHGRPAPLPAKNIAMQIGLAGERFPHGPIDLAGRDW